MKHIDAFLDSKQGLRINPFIVKFATEQNMTGQLCLVCVVILGAVETDMFNKEKVPIKSSQIQLR